MKEELAWEQIVDCYVPVVDRVARRAGLSEQDAEEVVQDVMTATFRNIGNIRRDGDRLKFRRWLFGVTRKRIASIYKRRETHQEKFGQRLPETVLHELSADSLTDSEILGSDPIHRAFIVEVVESLRGRVKDTAWQIFWRTVVDGVSNTDVADQLGIPASRVGTYKSRMLDKLRQRIKELFGPDGEQFPGLDDS